MTPWGQTSVQTVLLLLLLFFVVVVAVVFVAVVVFFHIQKADFIFLFFISINIFHASNVDVALCVACTAG